MDLNTQKVRTPAWASMAVAIGLCAMGLILSHPIKAEGIAPMPPQQAMPEPKPPAKELPKRLYISDNLKTALRTGPTTKHRISAFLASGTALNVKSSTDNWVEVSVVGTSKTGWVNQVSIQRQKGAAARLADQSETIKRLESKINTQRDQLSEVKADTSAKSQNVQSLTAQLEQLTQEHADLKSISTGAVKNHQKMAALRTEMTELESAHNELEIAHALLREDKYNQGMIHGIIAILVGVLLTLIVPKLRTPKRSNRW